MRITAIKITVLPTMQHAYLQGRRQMREKQVSFPFPPTNTNPEKSKANFFLNVQISPLFGALTETFLYYVAIWLFSTVVLSVITFCQVSNLGADTQGSSPVLLAQKLCRLRTSIYSLLSLTQ
ncbi:UV excision repair protein RAD23-like protein A [Platysternon megacephalum]|uniref:UV excision repair protein RAD23-like protein A n=1 Tax=Platysternon megacephalum TaxID=55544 RepID=A0A4D9E2F8_9SAUR|nr:UV excision repair protein RAD23-like protein A [Platysternon megacephalum]